MTNCVKCKKPVNEGEEREPNSQILCEDCYLEDVSPVVRKTFYEKDSSEFMRRLQESSSSHPQKYH